MVHVTAAIGLALAFLMQVMFWSVAPFVAAALVGGLIVGAIACAAVRAVRRKRAGAGPS